MALNAFSLDASADGLKLACLQSVPEVGYHNVTAQDYPQMRHEIHNETGYRRVWDDLLHFIDNTLNPS